MLPIIDQTLNKISKEKDIDATKIYSLLTEEIKKRLKINKNFEFMLKNIIHISNNTLLTLCVIFLSTLVIITVIDVIGRYILDLPLPGASELTEIILATLIYIGLPYICRDEGHVTVSIISNNLTSNFQDYIELL